MSKSVCQLLFAVHFLSPFRITTFHSTFTLSIIAHISTHLCYFQLDHAQIRPFQISCKHRLCNCHVRSWPYALRPPLNVHIYVRLFSSSTFLAKKEVTSFNLPRETQASSRSIWRNNLVTSQTSKTRLDCLAAMESTRSSRFVAHHRGSLNHGRFSNRPSRGRRLSFSSVSWRVPCTKINSPLPGFLESADTHRVADK